MSDNSNSQPQPDRATELDDEIPTYSAPYGSTHPTADGDDATSADTTVDDVSTPASPASEVYEKAGRAAPQHIPPRQPQSENTAATQRQPVPSTESDAARDREQTPQPRTWVDPVASALSHQAAAQAKSETEMPRAETDSDASAATEVLATTEASGKTRAPIDNAQARTEVIPVATPTPQKASEPAADAATEVVAPVVPAAPIAEETTVISRQPETATTTMAAVPPVAEAPAYIDEPEGGIDHSKELVAEAIQTGAKRGTMDFGILLIRLCLAGYLLTTSLTTFFYRGSSLGLQGLEQDFSQYALSGVLTIAIPTMQLAAGVFVLLGLLTPVAAAVATTATTFMALHAINIEPQVRIFQPTDSIWLGVVLVGLALALQFTGPGKVSFDAGRSWAKRPLASSWIFAVIGIAGAIALWWFGAGVNPFN